MSNIKGGTTRFGGARLANYTLKHCERCKQGIVRAANGKYCQECKQILGYRSYDSAKAHEKYLKKKAKRQQAKDNSK